MKLTGKNITKSIFKRIGVKNLFPFGKWTNVSTVIRLLFVTIISFSILVLSISHIIRGRIVYFCPQMMLSFGIYAYIIFLFDWTFTIVVDFQLWNDYRVVWGFVVVSTIPIASICQIIILWVIQCINQWFLWILFLDWSPFSQFSRLIVIFVCIFLWSIVRMWRRSLRPKKFLIRISADCLTIIWALYLLQTVFVPMGIISGHIEVIKVWIGYVLSIPRMVWNLIILWKVRYFLFTRSLLGWSVVNNVWSFESIYWIFNCFFRFRVYLLIKSSAALKILKVVSTY